MYLCNTEDVEWHIGVGAGNGEVPYFGVWHGRDEIRGAMESSLDSFVEELEFNLDKFYPVEENRVFSTGFGRYRVVATNREFSTTMCYEFEFRDGLVSKMIRHCDTAAFVEGYREGRAAS